MVFTDRRWLMRTGLMVLLAALAACATGPKPGPSPDESAATEVDAEPASGPSALPDGPVTPNPYAQMEAEVSPEARRAFERALAGMENEQWAEAESLLLDMTGRYPALSGPWVNLGKVYVALERPEDAEAALEKALLINSKNLEAYNQLALLKRKAGAFDEAEALYRRALDVWPFHARTHLNLGVLLDLYRGKGDEALLHYRAYQQRQEDMDRKVAGWIVDLERRLAAEEAQ